MTASPEFNNLDSIVRGVGDVEPVTDRIHRGMVELSTRRMRR